MKSKHLFLFGVGTLLTLGVLLLGACAGAEGPPGKDGAAGMDAAATCSECHNDTTLILSKRLQSDTTTHMTGGAHDYAGGRASCTACHSSEGFQELVATGMGIEDFEEAPANPTPQNCRTCHEIHTSYTKADFALRTTDPVTLLASGETFDMGDGNLCATCHQPRREMVAEDGIVNVSSTHWGPHYGSASAMLLGTGSPGVSGSPSAHYMLVEDGCVTCHMADGNHTLAPSTASCQSCHADATNFDIGGVQTEVEELLFELQDLLVAKGLLEVTPHGDEHPVPGEGAHPVVGKYSEAEAEALWAFRFIVPDGSYGVHNPKYTIALLEASIEALK